MTSPVAASVISGGGDSASSPQHASAMELLAAGLASPPTMSAAVGLPTSGLAARAAASSAAAAVITGQFGLGLATPETGRRRMVVSTSPARQALQLNCVGLGSYSRYGDQNGGRNLLVSRKTHSKATRNDYRSDHSRNIVQVAAFSAGRSRIPRPTSAASRRSREGSTGQGKGKVGPAAVTSTVIRVSGNHGNHHRPDILPHASVDIDASAAE